ncbi:MAG: hypothetical protein Q4A68_02645 [Anaerobiospirillum succiniciproducens]|uniref:hypothetical protein n=1 Tax=Anaerobiospirillum succiniciproducens TaxID=13335 RepID=UPI0026DB4939|nr:hypothetical protein [Anaerobiospirillum succiniciproducens]MDO4675469.1 hypothetical protein [Anaerobiospirillum succiniciproducens]
MLLFIEMRGAVAFCVCFYFAFSFLSCFCFVVFALLLLGLLFWLVAVAFGALKVGVLVVGGLKRQRAAQVEFGLGYPFQITDGDDLD